MDKELWNMKNYIHKMRKTVDVNISKSTMKDRGQRSR